MIRLANLDAETSWENFAWTDFACSPDAACAVAVLPIFGFADHGIGGPLDVEEVVGAAVLRRAALAVKSTLSLRVLPPLRFTLGPYPSSFFSVDPETAHDLVREMAEGVKGAGLHKLVFFNTSPWNEELIDSASRDVRAALGLQTFIINLSGLELDLHPGSATRARVQAVAARLLASAPKSSGRAADIRDADFRPGHFRQPAELAFDFSLNGFALLTEAAQRLARLLIEIDQRAPLSTSSRNVTKTVAPPAPAPTHLAPEAAELWPKDRTRYLGALTREEIEALPRKAEACIIVPTAAVEQHGPHLTVGVDAFLGQALLEATLPKLSRSAAVWIAPPLVVGKSVEHSGFPGTLSLSARSLRRLLLALARQVQALGFTRIAILNTHGGNTATLIYTLREIQATLGLRAGMLSGYYRTEQSSQESEYGFHAGELETSLMLACAPERVRMERAVCEYPARLDDPGELRPENAPAVLSWLTSDISESGVMGDATIATAEKGQRWLEQASTALAEKIQALLAE